MRKFNIVLGAVMVILYSVFGIFFLTSANAIPDKPNWVRIFMGSALLLYSLWRIVRIYRSITQKDTDEDSI